MDRHENHLMEGFEENRYLIRQQSHKSGDRAEGSVCRQVSSIQPAWRPCLIHTYSTLNALGSLYLLPHHWLFYFLKSAGFKAFYVWILVKNKEKAHRIKINQSRNKRGNNSFLKTAVSCHFLLFNNLVWQDCGMFYCHAAWIWEEEKFCKASKWPLSSYPALIVTPWPGLLSSNGRG